MKTEEDISNFDFSAAPVPSARVAAAIRENVAHDLTPVRRFSRAGRIGVSVLLFCVATASFAVTNCGDGVHHVTRSALLGAAGWALVVAGILVAGFGRFRAHSRWVQIGVACGLPLLFLGYLAALHTSWLPLGHFLASSVETSGALSCGLIALALGAVTSACVFFVWRCTDPFSPSLSGALAGLVGGLAGAMSVGLVCPGREGWHLWLGHGLCVVALALVGASVGRRVLTP